MENWSELKTVWSLFEAVSSETTLLPLFQRTLVIFHSMFSAEAVRLYTYEDTRWSEVSYPLEKTEHERPASPPELVGEEALKTQVSEERLVVRTEDVCLLIEGPSTERVTPETLDVVRSTVVKIAPVRELFRALWEAQRARRQTEERLRKQTVELRGLLRTRTGMIGTHPKMLRVLEGLERASSTKLPILITGETGTGKEAAARLVHRLSGRRAPLVVVDCGAVPASLLESELFGHEKGAFTGAESSKIGRFEEAHKGTLFLDEIGELPLALQPKLLRVLQESTVRRIGGAEEVELDFRLVAATNRDLEGMVGRGTFRQDLLFRLKVVDVRLPPLRERGEDIVLLGLYYLRQYCAEIGREQMAISTHAQSAMLEYEWPGNVRELQNRLRRAALMSTSDEITIEDLQIDPEARPVRRSAPAPEPVPEVAQQHKTDEALEVVTADWFWQSWVPKALEASPYEEVEAFVLRAALLKAEGGVRKAADALHMHPDTFTGHLAKLREASLSRSVKQHALGESIQDELSKPGEVSLLDRVLRVLLEELLVYCRGNQSEMARVLGWGRQTLSRHLRRLDVLKPAKGG